MLQIYIKMLLAVWKACTPSVIPAQRATRVVESWTPVNDKADGPASPIEGPRKPVDKLPTIVSAGPVREAAIVPRPVLTLIRSVIGCPEGVDVICVVGVLGLRRYT